MATLVLGTIGRAVGGPLGGLLGTVVGSALDRGLGGGKSREGARLSNLAIQSSAYGEPIPRHYGRMRAAGNLVWSAGIRETRQGSGSRKQGTATNTYSYSASFAVILAGRPITGVGRIWADGKLLRTAAGELIFPAIIRFYPGSENQPVDPLIAAAEGVDHAPAYRDRAYVVFEDLQLADYGNRIPNLTFEIVADPGENVGIGAIVGDIGMAVGIPMSADALPTVHGFVALGNTVREAINQLDDIADLSIADDGSELQVRSGGSAGSVAIGHADLGASAGHRVPASTDVRASAGSVPDAIIIGFSDPARDYQPGLQRAVRHTPVSRIEQRNLDAALDALTAKRVAGALLRRGVAARTTATVTLPWRHAALDPGTVVIAGADAEPWRIRTKTIAGLVVELGLERIAGGAIGGAADPGRVVDPGDRPQGMTTLHILDLPPLAGAVPTASRLWLAAAGIGRWSRAAVLVSVDGGDSYASVATIDAPTVMGTATGALVVGSSDRWDRRSMLDVELLDADMWLESRSEAAVLAGGNHALVGTEIIQFADVRALAPGRFRLSTLLRGRRGTEAAIASHVIGERFVLLDTTLTAFDQAPDAIGAPLLFKAAGPGDDPTALEPVALSLRSLGLRPLSPVFVRARAVGTGVDFTWVRRSRAGFAWTDGVDVPLAEESEVYRIIAMIDGTIVREVSVTAPSWRYDAKIIAADGGIAGAELTITVAQVSAVAGPGASAACTLTI